MTASPPAPAALALSAEQIAKAETLAYRLECDARADQAAALASKNPDAVAFFEDSATVREQDAALIRTILAAIAAPAPAVVGDLAGDLVFDKDGRYLDFQTGYDIADGDRRAGLTSKPVYYAAAPRPSRDDGGEANVGALRAVMKAADEWRHTVPGTLLHEHKSAELRQLCAGVADAHPPAPAAENGRVGELQRAWKDLVEHPGLDFSAEDDAAREVWDRFARMMAALGGAK